MLTGLSKKFKRFLPHTNRTVVIAVLFLIAAGVLTPLLAEAFDCNTFQFSCHIMHGIFLMMKNLAVWPLKWASAILNWIVGGLNIGYTPDTNPVIKAGWEPARDFANMFFIVALVIIGIATALRYKEYQAQKALPKLLIVALLINFTPVLAATAINASDTTMNYFLQTGVNVTTVSEKLNVGDAKTNNLVNFVDNFFADLSGRGMDSLGFVLGASTFLLLFSWGAAIIYSMFAALFLVRYVILWFLIIVSPLAFITYIFPASKEKIWDPWWEQFVNWCIIVIPAAITLYLGKEVLANAHKMTTSGELDSVGLGKQLGSFIGMFSIPLVFLVIGYLVTLQVSAMGSEAVIKGAKTAGKWGAGLAGKGLKSGAEATGLPDRVRNKLEDMRTSKKPEPEEWDEMDTREKVQSSVGSAIAPHPVRRAIGRAGARRMNTPSQQIQKEKKDYKGKDAGEKLSYFMGATNKRKKLAILKSAQDEGQLETMKKMGLDSSEVKETLLKTSKRAPTEAKEIIRNYPVIADDVEDIDDTFKSLSSTLNEEQRKKAGLDMSDDDKEKYGNLTTKITAEMSPSVIEGLSDDVFEEINQNPNSNLAKGMTHWDGRQYSKAAQEFGSIAADAFHSAVNEKGVWEFARENSSGASWARSNAGGRMGFQIPAQRTISTPGGGGTGGSTSTGRGSSGGGTSRTSSSGISSASGVSGTKKSSSKERGISDEEFEQFSKTGKVNQERLRTIAERIAKNNELSDREEAIKRDKTNEIEDILEDIRRNEGG